MIEKKCYRRKKKAFVCRERKSLTLQYSTLEQRIIGNEASQAALFESKYNRSNKVTAHAIRDIKVDKYKDLKKMYY